MDESLDSLVRRVDEDRWLASRFAPADVRARLITLYALNHEIARSTELVSQPALGDIRLTWWREAIAGIHDGKIPRAQPALLALSEVVEAWPREAFDPLIEARRRDLDSQPFASIDAFEAYIDGTAGTVMRLALRACGISVDESLVHAAARAWGYVAWMRARRPLPSGKGVGIMLQTASAWHGSLYRQTIPASAFPAMGYVALIHDYMRAYDRQRSPPALLSRQLRLIAASVTGGLF